MTNVYNTWLKFLSLFSHETRSLVPKVSAFSWPLSRPTYSTSWKDGALCLVWWVSQALQSAPWVASNIQVLPKYLCKHNSNSVGVRLLWPPCANTLPQDKQGREAGGKGCTKKHFSPAAECVFPSASLTFCEVLPTHLGMPEREGCSPKNKTKGSWWVRTHMQGWVTS